VGAEGEALGTLDADTEASGTLALLHVCSKAHLSVGADYKGRLAALAGAIVDTGTSLEGGESTMEVVVDVGGGMGVNATGVAAAVDEEAFAVPVAVDPEVTPADTLVSRHQGAELVAVDDGIFEHLGVDPSDLVAGLGAARGRNEGKLADVLDTDAEASGTLELVNRSGEQGAAVSDDGYASTITTPLFVTILEADAAREICILLLKIVFDVGGSMCENTVFVMASGDLEASGVPGAIHPVAGPAHSFHGGHEITEKGVLFRSVHDSNFVHGRLCGDAGQSHG